MCADSRQWPHSPQPRRNACLRGACAPCTQHSDHTTLKTPDMCLCVLAGGYLHGGGHSRRVSEGMCFSNTHENEAYIPAQIQAVHPYASTNVWHSCPEKLPADVELHATVYNVCTSVSLCPKACTLGSTLDAESLAWKCGASAACRRILQNGLKLRSRQVAPDLCGPSTAA